MMTAGTPERVSIWVCGGFMPPDLSNRDDADALSADAVASSSSVYGFPDPVLPSWDFLLAFFA
jgi:hypothetical protein